MVLIDYQAIANVKYLNVDKPLYTIRYYGVKLQMNEFFKTEIFKELIKVAPYGAFGLIAIWIVSHSLNSTNERLENVFNKTVEEIRKSYEYSIQSTQNLANMATDKLMEHLKKK